MNDIARVLRTGERATVAKRTRIGKERGWAVASAIITERVPMWCVAAGLDPPTMPAVDGFDDLPLIVETLRSIPVEAARDLPPDVRSEGLRLAQMTHANLLHAIETALEHADYPHADKARLCRVENELERLLPMLGALAVQRHREMVGAGPFDLTPWVASTEALAQKLER